MLCVLLNFPPFSHRAKCLVWIFIRGNGVKALLANYLWESGAPQADSANQYPRNTMHNGHWTPLHKRRQNNGHLSLSCRLCCVQNCRARLFSMIYYSFVYSCWVVPDAPNYKKYTTEISLSQKYPKITTKWGQWKPCFNYRLQNFTGDFLLQTTLICK